jgi:hypothetical protein
MDVGLPTRHRREPARYTLVTVLFADVVHSMDIPARRVRSGCARSGASWSATAHR